jgi:hypothetical protein
VEIHASARKHGFADADICHAATNAMTIDDQDGDTVLYLGPARNGELLEVVTLLRRFHGDGDPYDEDATQLPKTSPWRPLMAKEAHGKTASGVPITDELVRELAKKAEAGYDVDETLRRRGGRPPLGSGPASIESVRVDPDLRAALRARAARDHETPSAVIRAALHTYLEGDSSAETQTALKLLGVPFLAYVLNVSEEALAERITGSAQLGTETEHALSDVLAHAKELASDSPFGEPDALPDGSPLVRMRRFGWTDLDRGHTHANLFRLATAGELPAIPEGLSPAETAIARAAIDHFPSTLLPLEERTQFLPPKPLISRARVHQLEAALQGEPITQLFAHGTVFYTSSGMGYGPLWTYRVAECALATAEQRVRMLGDKRPGTFITEAVENLRRMRELVTLGVCSLPTIVGFWNAEIPDAAELDGPRGGRLRAARRSDPHVAMAARATMVLETTCDVGLHVGAKPPSAGSTFWAGTERLVVDEKIISLAALLAGPNQGGQLAMPALAWTHVFDPFQPYVGRFVSAPSGPPTVPFPSQRMSELEQWIARLDSGYDASIRVAVDRTLSAVTDRGPSDDALIDYVIALENLFGRPGPKLETRLSSALAALLASGETEGSAIAARSRRVYQARSKLVHGDQLLESEEHPADQAQLLVLDAFRTLFTTHRHLIADRKGRQELGEKRRKR